MNGESAVSRGAQGPSLRECLLAGTFLTLVAGLVFGSHVVEGGFYSDDWSLAADYRFADPPRVLTVAEHIQQELGARFVSSPAFVLPHALFGLDTRAHLALAVGLGVLAALTFYILLRTLGLEPVHAGAIALLALLFPWSDSTRLWPTGGINNVSVILYLLSVIVAVRGLRFSRVRGIVTHGCAQILYLLSVFAYEAPLLAIFLSGSLYMHFAPSRRKAFERWRADVLLGLAAIISVAILSRRPVPSLWEVGVEAVLFLTGGTALLGHSVLPFGLPDAAAALGAVSLVVSAAWLLHRSSTGRPIDPSMRRWVVAGTTAAAFVAAAHVIFLGSGLVPLRQGIENRGNVFAAYGYVVMAYSIIMVTAGLLSKRSPTDAPPRRRFLAISALAAVALGYAVQVSKDALRWDQAAREQGRVLRTVKTALPDPPPGSTVYVTGAPPQISPGIPVFNETWDLSSALQLMFADHSLDGYATDARTTFVCTSSVIYPSRPGSPYGPADGYGKSNAAPYGHAFWVDARAGHAQPIDNRADCRLAARRARQLGVSHGVV